jgi:hypothetical protein
MVEGGKTLDHYSLRFIEVPIGCFNFLPMLSTESEKN